MAAKRLYLFDIDSTLIATGGAGGMAMRAAFEALWGSGDSFRNIEFSGRSDLAIFHNAWRDMDRPEEAFAPDLRRFRRAYYRRLHETLVLCDGRVLPGVVPLLDELKADADVTLALGTGNFRTSAGIKLAYYGLSDYFRDGGFGDRTMDRAAFIATGIRAANRRAGYKHDEVIVVGDTVHDIAAGLANAATAVGVATGSTTGEELREAGAHIVLESLEDAAALLPRRAAAGIR